MSDSLGGPEQRWSYVARKNDFVCERCGEYPPYEERETFFDSRLCGYCKHQHDKLMDD